MGDGIYWVRMLIKQKKELITKFIKDLKEPHNKKDLIEKYEAELLK